jgi:hypothetical protein
MSDRVIDDVDVSDRGRMIEIERRVLRILCQSVGEALVRERARELLANYRWSDGAHQAVFEITMCFPSTSCQALREQLPARLTRRGFPDFDLDALFTIPAPSGCEAEAWIRKLAQAQARWAMPAT